MMCVAEIPEQPCVGQLASIEAPMILEHWVAQPTGLSCREKAKGAPLSYMEDPYTIPGVNKVFLDRESAMKYLRSMTRK